MSNPYIYNNYQQTYSPSLQQVQTNSGAGGNGSSSPTFHNLNYIHHQHHPQLNGISIPENANLNSNSNSASSTTSSVGSSYSNSTNATNYSFSNPRLRYYLSKSFDIEDDLEFCPDIPDHYSQSSPPLKKFNPYTASVFSPQQSSAESQTINLSPVTQNTATVGSNSPRAHTSRIKKPLEIINPQTKMRVGSPAIHNK